MNFQPPGILEIGTSSEAAVQSLDNKWQNAISGVAGRDNAALLGLVTEAVGTLGLPVYPPKMASLTDPCGIDRPRKCGWQTV